MKKKFFSTILFAGIAMVCMAMVIIDVTGKWSGTLTTPDGQSLDLVYTLKADGDKLTGTAASQEGELKIENGKINGSQITFSVNRQGEDVQHTGKVYADSIGMDIESPSFKFHVLLKKNVK